MLDLGFYNLGCERSSHKRDLVVIPRRIFRRLMRPMLFRLEEILTSLVKRHDRSDINILTIHTTFLVLRAEVTNLQGQVPTLQHEVAVLRHELFMLSHEHRGLAEQTGTAIAMAWDEPEVARRLAVLEAHLESLLPTNFNVFTGNKAIPAILFPGLELAKRHAS